MLQGKLVPHESSSVRLTAAAPLHRPDETPEVSSGIKSLVASAFSLGLSVILQAATRGARMFWLHCWAAVMSAIFFLRVHLSYTLRYVTRSIRLTQWMVEM